MAAPTKQGFLYMSREDVQRSELHANWRDFINSVEIERLATLDQRIERKKLILDYAIAERQKIMARAIRRMRRAAGKT